MSKQDGGVISVNLDHIDSYAEECEEGSAGIQMNHLSVRRTFANDSAACMSVRRTFAVNGGKLGKREGSHEP